MTAGVFPPAPNWGQAPSRALACSSTSQPLRGMVVPRGPSAILRVMIPLHELSLLAKTQRVSVPGTRAANVRYFHRLPVGAPQGGRSARRPWDRSLLGASKVWGAAWRLRRIGVTLSRPLAANWRVVGRSPFRDQAASSRMNGLASSRHFAWKFRALQSRKVLAAADAPQNFCHSHVGQRVAGFPVGEQVSEVCKSLCRSANIGRRPRTLH
jgi:hypothetical protein